MRLFVTLATLLTGSAAAQAHFIWLEPVTHDDGTTTIQVYFGEDASPDDPEYLGRVKDMQLQQVTGKQDAQPLKLTLTAESLSSGPVNQANSSLFIGSQDLGVLERGDAVFGLRYYAKTGPAITSEAWTQTVTSDDLRFDIVPRFEGGRVFVQVRFDGELVKGAQVVASGQGMDDFEGVTTSEGEASFAIADPGLYSIRARHTEQASGESDGQAYKEVRHYTTLAVDVPATTEGSGGSVTMTRQLPELPEMVTSFGAAVSAGSLYVYGGHTGDAHSYSTAEQANQVRRVSLAGGEWETLAVGPHLQGLALVSHGGKLYRIGGFTAKNAEGEAHDLWSQDSVAAFDPDAGEWFDLPPLPEPRSSHDAVVVGDTIYVVGGWALAGEAESTWHETAWAMDLSQPERQWKPLPTAPFKRRALALAAHQGKLYAIGGMQEDGGPTTSTAIFDPESQTWSDGPALVVEQADQPDGDTARSSGAMTGFGASAFATGGRLYVSTIKGDLQRLTEDGTAWEILAQTPTARFFHRMLPIDDHHLLMVGGANMQTGKYSQIEVLTVESGSVRIEE